MQSKPRLRFTPFKLHTRTTILTSAVLVAVFAVIAYFSDLAITKVSDQQEQQQAQLLATRIADTVEHHIKRLKSRNERRKKHERIVEESESTTVPDWDEVREEIEDTIVKNYPQLAEVRVFEKAAPNQWEEKVTLPVEADPLSSQEKQEATERIDALTVTVRQEGQNRLIGAKAAINVLEGTGPTQIGTVSVAARLRRKPKFRGRASPLDVAADAACYRHHHA